MKIALFHNDRNKTAARTIGAIITAHDCTVDYLDEAMVWDANLCKNPLKLLETATHMLFIHSSDVTDISSFIFFAGYCLGKGIPVLVIETDGKLQIPDNCRHLGIILKSENFEEYFLAEQLRFKSEDKKNRARTLLLERGISCFEENFLLIAGSGDAEAVSLFLDAGFSPTIADLKGTPLLSIAVRAQFPHIVSLLLEAGAEVNRLSLDRGYSPLMDAAQKGDAVIVKLLLDHGADPDLRSKDGQTALIICAGRGDEEMAELLVSSGADPAITDRLGMSAVSYAKLFNNRKMMDLFNPSPP